MSSTHGRPSVEQPAAEAVAKSGIPTPRPTSEPAGGDGSYQGYVEGTASAYATLAGWLLILGGAWDFFVGLALVVRSSYFSSLPGYAATTHYAYRWNLSSWGWANLIFGIVVAACGVCVLLGYNWARWTGIALAVVGGMGTFLFLPIYPLWSIMVIAIDVFIIWALVSAPRRQPS
jgi:hypothetical protein